MKLSPAEAAIREEAALWAARRREDPSDESAAALTAWLNQSPRHMGEYMLAQALWGELQNIDRDRRIEVNESEASQGSEIVPLREGSAFPTTQPAKAVAGEIAAQPAPALQALRPRPRRLKWWMAAAATLTALLFGAFWLYRISTTYATEKGEQRTVRLADGSLVELNTQTRIRVDFSQRIRAVRLLEGEALFTVARADRPFVVSSGTAVVQALGTQFSVYRKATGTRVAVLEGRVQVVRTSDETLPFLVTENQTQGGAATNSTADRPSAMLDAGEEIDVSRGGQLSKMHKPDVAGAVSWRQRRLTFNDQPLAEVVSEFQRYSNFKITLEGAALSQRRIRGVFHSDRPESLIDFLAADETLSVKRTKDAAIVTVRP